MAGPQPLQKSLGPQVARVLSLRSSAPALRLHRKRRVYTKMESTDMIFKDVVLVGGGHTHVEVLRSFGMKPMHGVRLTLITKDAHTAYSGMLPGYVSGFYSHDDCQVDLNRLARYANARLILQPATGLDTKKQEVYIEGRPPIGYDVLSLDVGITPSAQGVPGALQHATPVKPVHDFVDRFERLLERVHQEDRDIIVAVVGGGAGGVELSLSVHHRLRTELRTSAHKIKVKLFTKSRVLGGYTSSVRAKFLRILQEKGIELHEGVKIVAVEGQHLLLDSQQPEAYDECLWCTQALAPGWLQQTDLTLDPSGFVPIEEDLRVQGSPGNVFCVGDMASSVKHPRPKAGVYAVRQGPPLTDNIRRLLSGTKLKPFKPQSSHLSLITTGDHYAVATKGWFCLEGAWLWDWKDRIDRQWMDKYGKDLAFGDMQGSMARSGSKQNSVSMDTEALAALSASKMRCGGCGSKVGATVLSRVLQRLQQHSKGAGGVMIGLDEGDDAAVVRPPPAGHVTVHTVDFFRSFISDPYVFGRIAAVHALGDCHAMGAAAKTALATAVIPYGLESKTEADLHQMMAGAVHALSEAGCSLVGGHTCEGAEMSLGFSVNGEVKETEIMRKGGLQPGQALILTKSLGSGIIFAADMRGKARGAWVSDALEHMQQSSAEAAALLKEAGATGCTDVTGFGLLGHLGEMTRASQVSVQIHADSILFMEGALQCAERGIASSLLPSNLKAAALIGNAVEGARLKIWPLLFDPQTSGGLLAGVPEDAAQEVIQRLQSAGYSCACVIGNVLETGTAGHQNKPEVGIKCHELNDITLVGSGL